jgi:hypothetical protein
MKVRVDTFLKGENLGDATSKTPVTGTIKGVKLIAAKDLPYESENDAYQLSMVVKGEEYDWTPNKTSLKEIVRVFGDESDNWTDKTIGLYSVEQSAFGKVQQIVYAVGL